MSELEALQAALKYSFKNASLLLEAITHSTYANENSGAGGYNERLEFLGDAVLGLLTARILVERLPEAPEGELSQRRARVVSRDGLAQLAERINLSQWLRVGEGQRKAGVSASILADAYEALAGAVFLDGGLSAIDATFAKTFEKVLTQADVAADFKTTLQELCHKRRLSPPVYRVVEQSGPDHARHFVCEVLVDDASLGRGEGSSKKVAEQACAKEALEKLSQ